MFYVQKIFKLHFIICQVMGAKVPIWGWYWVYSLEHLLSQQLSQGFITGIVEEDRTTTRQWQELLQWWFGLLIRCRYHLHNLFITILWIIRIWRWELDFLSLYLIKTMHTEETFPGRILFLIMKVMKTCKLVSK